MSSLVSDTLNKARTMVAGEKGAKVAQLDQVSQDVTKDDRITTDFGVKQANTDDWLSLSRDDKTGPLLLEDSAAREKVRDTSTHSHTILQVTDTATRSTVSIMNGFPNV